MAEAAPRARYSPVIRERVDGPAPPPIDRSPSRTASDGHHPRPPAPPRAASAHAPGRRPAPTSACSPTRARRRRGGARPRSRGSPGRRSRGRSPPPRCPPVMTTAAGPRLRIRHASSRASSSSSRSASTRASGRLGVTTVASGRICSRSASRASSRSSSDPLSETITGSTTTGTLADQPERLAHRLDRRHVAEHPDLHRVHADVVHHRPHLVEHGRGGQRVDRGHLARVLGRDRGDRRHPVRPAARERLQVRLDPGTATGVGPGDGEQSWRCGRVQGERGRPGSAARIGARPRSRRRPHVRAQDIAPEAAGILHPRQHRAHLAPPPRPLASHAPSTPPPASIAARTASASAPAVGGRSPPPPPARSASSAPRPPRPHADPVQLVEHVLGPGDHRRAGAQQRVAAPRPFPQRPAPAPRRRSGRGPRRTPS